MQLINKDSFLSYQNINTDVIALTKQLIPRDHPKPLDESKFLLY